MKVEMLRARGYRGQHLEVGVVTDMDGQTAAWFVEMGWARPYAEPAPLTTKEADALVPTKVTRRNSVR